MSDSPQPLISVILPFYRNVPWLHEALDSALRQTHRNLEIIVINDGSPETLDLERFDDPRIRLLEQANQGPGAARNAGLAVAKGAYVAFLDSDDLWEPPRLAEQLAEMQAANAVWSCTSYRQFGAVDRLVDCSKMNGYIYRRLAARSRIAMPTVMVRNDVLQADPSLRFASDFRYGEDLVLWLKLALRFPILHAKSHRVLVRMRGSNAARRVWEQLAARNALYELLSGRPDEYRWDSLGFFTRLGYRLATKGYGRYRDSRTSDALGYVLYLVPWLCFALSDRLRPATLGFWRRARRVAVCAPFFVPAVRAGGPIPGIQGVLANLKGQDVRVFTSNRDLGDAEPYPAPYRGTTVVEGTPVTYLPPPTPAAAPQWLRSLWAIRSADVVYLNSCFSAPFSILPLLWLWATGYRGKVLISPRGELAPAALRRGRSRAKSAWLKLILRLGLDERVGSKAQVTWIASSAHESIHITDQFVNAAVAIVPEHLRSWQGAVAAARAPGAGPLRIISVGRIAPIKGTLQLVQAAVKAVEPMRVTLVGLAEDHDYVAEVEKVANKAPAHVEVVFAGALSPAAVRTELLDSDLFVLLTQGENFGHAIGEALQTGLPVVISDRTPWSRVADRDAGTVIPVEELDDAGRVARVLDTYARLSLAERVRRGRAAVQAAELANQVPGQRSMLDLVTESDPGGR